MQNYLDIPLMGNDRNVYCLRDFSHEKLVLYFYPKDNTPGCTLEAKDFTRLKTEFATKGFRIIGVSKDSVSSHERFCSQHNLDILLLSDPDTKLAEAFGVLKEKSMYGRTYMGIERSTFLIDEHGRITKEYRGVSATDHAITILEEL